MPEARYDAEMAEVERSWGTPELAREWVEGLYPGHGDDPREVEDFLRSMHAIGGPGDAARWLLVDRDLDLRDVLPSIRVPTLVLHRVDDREVSIEHGRYLARHIPGAELRELPGDAHIWSRGEDLPAEVQRFLTTLSEEATELDRYLGTVLFTDIVGSTSAASAAGDAAWRELIQRHHHVVRSALARYREVEMDTAGDGFFATFEGPARAIRCGLAIVDGVRDVGIEVRVGVHTGELQEVDGKAGGIAVSLGARIMALAGASQVLVSQTVRDLVAGSGLSFEDAGEHELKGVPDRWHLYRVTS
jgi:class 3 adenylate cyclase